MNRYHQGPLVNGNENIGGKRGGNNGRRGKGGGIGNESRGKILERAFVGNLYKTTTTVSWGPLEFPTHPANVLF